MQHDRAVVVRLSVVGSILEPRFCALGEGLDRAVVTGLAADELLAVNSRLLAAGVKGGLELLASIVTKFASVTGSNRILRLGLSIGYAVLCTVYLAGSITNDQRGNVVAHSLNRGQDCSRDCTNGVVCFLG